MNIVPWKNLIEVLNLLAPIIAFAFISAAIIHLLSVASHQAMPRGLTNTQIKLDDNDAAAPKTLDSEFGNASRFSYIFLASVFGIVFGMMLKLFGGFAALKDGSSNTVIGAIATVLVLIIGVTGSLFTDTDKINLRRPLGAIAFLLTFLVSGFYWTR